MAQKPTHHGNSPSPSNKLDNKSRTPQRGGFSAALELNTHSLYQESVDEKMRLLANLMIDKILQDKNNGTLRKVGAEK